MNSFYASVEMACDPTLKGKPLAIAGNPEERRGIIVTCSYEARKHGVKTTMPLWEAKKLCPDLIIRKPNFERYRHASKAMFELLREYTELVEPVSIDEGYVDVTELAKKIHPLQLAHTIQNRLLADMQLPCSIGIAPNKFLAKMASNMKKPLGITVLRKRDMSKILWPLPIEDMHGVGEKTAIKLKTIGVTTIGDLPSIEDIQMKLLLGINGIRLKERAMGIDNRAVDPDAIYDFKSIGNSTTLSNDTTDEKQLQNVIRKLAQSVSNRMHNKHVLSKNVQVTIRYASRQTITRSRKLDNPIMTTEAVFDEAYRLFQQNWNGDAVRLLGVTAQDLLEKQEAYKQLDIFSYEKDVKDEPIISAMSRINKKYGANAIKKGFDKKPSAKHTSDIMNETSFNKDFLQDD
ncbi:DNA polymerase IV [Bacillus sp. HMF5848]|nr:DNA polymerase IV [Bacillus sp. HMF5848]